MVTVPAATPVTTPVFETVAIAVFEDVQGVVACAVAEPVRVDVLPTQATNVPVIVGKGLTVNVAEVSQPFVFLYVIIVVPTLKAETTPVVETVAIVVFDDAQGVVGCAVAVPVRLDVLPMQALSVPLIDGKELMIITIIAFPLSQPAMFV